MPYSEEQHPKYAERIRELREARGLSIEQAADESGISFSNHLDLESYDDEILMCVSLRELTALGRMLGVDPIGLLAPDPDRKPVVQLSRSELAQAILKFVNDSRQSISAFEEQVGWEVAAALEDSEKILGWNIDCLSDVCAAIGVNWLEALPETKDCQPSNAPDAFGAR